MASENNGKIEIIRRNGVGLIQAKIISCVLESEKRLGGYEVPKEQINVRAASTSETHLLGTVDSAVLISNGKPVADHYTFTQVTSDACPAFDKSIEAYLATSQLA
jgi:hypothetical protein